MRFKTVAFGFEKSSVNTFIHEQTALSNSRINTAEDAQKKAEEALFSLKNA
jgi:RecA-family ATPase